MFNSVFMRPTPQFKKLIYSSIILGDYETFLSCAMQFPMHKDHFMIINMVYLKSCPVSIFKTGFCSPKWDL